MSEDGRPPCIEDPRCDLLVDNSPHVCMRVAEHWVAIRHGQEVVMPKEVKNYSSRRGHTPKVPS